jgi:pantoate--beta-alanine ligase
VTATADRVVSPAVQVCVTPDAMRAWSRAERTNRRTIAVVPTMGALHAGHLALVAEARRRCDRVIVTIFVNPLQFDRSSDFDAYPRPIDDDLERCRAAGVHAVYAPTAAVIYPPGFQTHVEPGALADRLEGPMRPGHFRGVTTVVTKLLAATCPDVAVFGRKDFQQLSIIRRMVADLDLGIEVVGVPIVRETDGLALSSRNVRLADDDRAAAVVISRALDAAESAHRSGESGATALLAIVGRIVAGEPLASLEYAELVDVVTLEPVDEVDRPAVLLVAAWFGGVRLIDNRELAG